MEFKDSKVYRTFKKYESFIMAVEGLSIILLLTIIWMAYAQSNNLQEEISLQCGWGEEDYQCYCEKSEAIKIRNLIEQNNSELNLSGLKYVEVDR